MYHKLGKSPLEFINIQPTKGGLPLKFINIQPRGLAKFGIKVV